MIPAVSATSPVGVKSPCKLAVVVALATMAETQRNLQRLELRAVDLELVVDAIAHHAVTRAGDQLVLGVGSKGAVAGVVAAGRFPLDDEEAVALDGQVGMLLAVEIVPCEKLGVISATFMPRPCCAGLVPPVPAVGCDPTLWFAKTAWRKALRTP